MPSPDDQLMSKLFYIGLLLSLLLVSCIGQAGSADITATPVSVIPSPIPTQTLIPATLTATVTPLPTETILPSSTPEPLGCQKPTEDYSRLEVNGWTLNQRTLTMLAHAQELYGGELEITGYAITQGSYHDNGSASFGTHLGGGAVDLSVLRRGTTQMGAK